jgi:hypothetical protein
LPVTITGNFGMSLFAFADELGRATASAGFSITGTPFVVPTITASAPPNQSLTPSSTFDTAIEIPANGATAIRIVETANASVSTFIPEPPSLALLGIGMLFVLGPGRRLIVFLTSRSPSRSTSA